MIKLKNILNCSNVIVLENTAYAHRNNLYSWQLPSGEFIPVKLTEEHYVAAIKILTNYFNINLHDGNYTKTVNVFNKMFSLGCMRITANDQDIYMENNIKIPTRIQLKKLINLAVDTNRKAIIYDNHRGNRDKILWSVENRLEEAPIVNYSTIGDFSKDASFVGTCISILDDRPDIFDDATQMAFAVENADKISYVEFDISINDFGLPRLIKLKLRKHPNKLEYSKYKDIYILYDVETDIHYFFL
jgi:hypothetical protein